jgi:hypothetical protein
MVVGGEGEVARSGEVVGNGRGEWERDASDATRKPLGNGKTQSGGWRSLVSGVRRKRRRRADNTRRMRRTRRRMRRRRIRVLKWKRGERMWHTRVIGIEIGAKHGGELSST